MDRTEKRICEFYGREIIYKIQEDKYNIGHGGRNTPEVTYVHYDYECDAEIKAKEFVEALKKQCTNCKFYNANHCENETVIRDILENTEFELFVAPTDLTSIKLKDNTKKCDDWEFNTKLLFK